MLKTIPWNLVDIKVLGIETEHAGKVFEGTEKDISNYLQSMGFKETHKNSNLNPKRKICVKHNY